MGAEDHGGVRELLGSYALGILEPDETARVHAHLDGCAECRGLAEQLGSVAAALPAADPDEVRAPATDAAGVGPLLARVASERRGRRRRRFAAQGGALVAVAAAATVVLVLALGSEGPATPPAPAPPATVQDLRSLRTGITGSVALADRFWGTQLTLKADGLPAQRRVFVWLQRRDGRRVPAGTLYGLGGRTLRAELAAGLRARDTVAVGVSDAGGRDLLTAPTRR